MNPAERDRELAKKSPTARATLLAKLQEYEVLPRPIREARLCQTELHWELSRLMRLAPGDRANQLKEVSVLYRPMIESLLQQWDKVPADLQKSLLEKQNFISVYLRMQGSPAAVQQEILDKLPPERRAHWAEEMDRWQAMPEKQRADLCAQFQRFCAMDGQEQKEMVAVLSAADGQEMKKALQAFDLLPLAQRARFINYFRKFAIMTPVERTQFFKNAARWDAMTSHERQLWREMVHTLPSMPPMPPLPPGLLPRPPLPPGLAPELPWPQRFSSGKLPMPPMPPNVTTPVIIASQQTK